MQPCLEKLDGLWYFHQIFHRVQSGIDGVDLGERGTEPAFELPFAERSNSIVDITE